MHSLNLNQLTSSCVLLLFNYLIICILFNIIHLANQSGVHDLTSWLARQVYYVRMDSMVIYYYLKFSKNKKYLNVTFVLEYIRLRTVKPGTTFATIGYHWDITKIWFRHYPAKILFAEKCIFILVSIGINSCIIMLLVPTLSSRSHRKIHFTF